MSRIDVDLVRGAARGRWIEILNSVAKIPVDFLDSRNHPCPKCGGHDRFRMLDVDEGALFCNQCFNSKNGDGIAAVQWLLDTDFKSALQSVADYLGIVPEKSPAARDPAKNLIFSDWNSSVVQFFCRHHGIEESVLQFAGARLASYRKRYPVIALPCFGSGLISADPVGWFIRPVMPGSKLPAWENKRLYHVTKKMTAGSRTGVFNEGALRKLLESPQRAIVRTEGPTDMLVAQGRLRWAACISFSHGAQGNAKPWMLNLFSGRQATVVGDTDIPGVEGLYKWIQEIRPQTSSLAVIRLPYGITDRKGKDYSDSIHDGHTEDIVSVEEWIRTPDIEQTLKAKGLLVDNRGEDEAATEEPEDWNPDSVEIIRNYRMAVEGHGEEPAREPVDVNEVVSQITTSCGGWPKFRSNELIWVWGDDVVPVRTGEQLTGMIAAKMGQTPEIIPGAGFPTKSEILQACRVQCEHIAEIEYTPHFPPRDDTYYMRPQPQPYKENPTHHVRYILDMLNPETDLDRQMIFAMFATVFWPRSGAKPMFYITARSGQGAGKSKLIDLASQIADTGISDLSQKENEDKMRERLLSNDARRKRIVRIDNVKSPKFGWSHLESMITAPIISGRQMYVGEASRRNTMTWVVTGNWPQVTTDIAQRTVFVHLGRPTYDGNWEQHIFGYVKKYRAEIWREFATFFERPVDPDHTAVTRWGEWERQILSRIPGYGNILQRMRERAEEYDVENKLSEEIEDVVAAKLRLYNLDRTHNVFLPTSTIREWYDQVNGTKHTNRQFGRMIGQVILQGKMRRLDKYRTKHSRGFIWNPSDLAEVNLQLSQGDVLDAGSDGDPDTPF